MSRLKYVGTGLLVLAVAFLAITVVLMNTKEEEPEYPTLESASVTPVEEPVPRLTPVPITAYDNQAWRGIDYKEPRLISDNYVEPLQDLSEYVSSNDRLFDVPPHYHSGLGEAGTFVPVRRPMQIRENCWVSGQFMCDVEENSYGYIEEVAVDRKAFLDSIEAYVPYRITEKECYYYALWDIAEALYEDWMEKSPYTFYYLGNNHWGVYWTEYKGMVEDCVPLWRNGYAYYIGTENLQPREGYWTTGEYEGLDFDIALDCSIAEDSIFMLMDKAAETLGLPIKNCHYKVYDMDSCSAEFANVEALKEAGYDIKYAMISTREGAFVHAAILKDGTVIGYDITKQHEVSYFE